MKKMKLIHKISIILGAIITLSGIGMAIYQGSFQEYFQLVFLGCILLVLGLINSKEKYI